MDELDSEMADYFVPGGASTETAATTTAAQPAAEVAMDDEEPLVSHLAVMLYDNQLTSFSEHIGRSGPP